MSTWTSMRRLCFCQAEDGIRYIGVTGVQTCALPIFDERRVHGREGAREEHGGGHDAGADEVDVVVAGDRADQRAEAEPEGEQVDRRVDRRGEGRSEERRVGTAWRSWWSPYH